MRPEGGSVREHDLFDLSAIDPTYSLDPRNVSVQRMMTGRQ
jgi:hypothetical protein